MSEQASPHRRLRLCFNVIGILLLLAAIGAGGWFGWLYLQQKEQLIAQLQQRISALETLENKRQLAEKLAAEQKKEDELARSAQEARQLEEAKKEKEIAEAAHRRMAEEVARKVVTEQLNKEKQAAARVAAAQAQREAARRAAADKKRKAAARQAAAERARKREEAQKARRRAMQQAEQQEPVYPTPFPQPVPHPQFHYRGPTQPYWPYPYGGYRIFRR